jgi:HAD superfamily hydrolase (TIGR01549 family)
MVKGILFDVHGTLIDKGGMEAVERGRAKIVTFLNANGIPLSNEAYKEVWIANLKKHRKDYEELNEVSFYGWYKGILNDLGISDPGEAWIDQLNEEWMHAFIETTTEIQPAKRVLSELKPLYRLGVISNSLGRNTEVDLVRTGLRNFFDVLTVSSEIGKRKPHPEIFQAALNAMGLKAEEAIMVGDNLQEDIVGAKNAGMKTVYVPQEDSLKMIAELGKTLSDSENKPSPGPEEHEPLEVADGVLESLADLKDLISAW